MTKKKALWKTLAGKKEEFVSCLYSSYRPK